jgi:hypothetical protein
MRGIKEVFIAMAVCACAPAQVAPSTIRISSETAPPGGMAQMKVLLTSPMPITSGGMFVDLSAVDFASIDGIALFNANGDVNGAAVVNGGNVDMKFTSPNGTFGATVDYPIMTVALSLKPTSQNGQIFPVVLNPSASFWQNLLGLPIAVELKPGSITVGGSVSITNILPGGGVLPAGGTFRILGMGFSPQTQVQVAPLKASSIQYVSSSEILVTVKDGGLLDGTKIQVTNPDRSSDTYYSYLRGVPVGVSARALLARTVPAFSIRTMFDATLPSTISPTVNADYFTAIALQNPGASDAVVTLESHDASGALTGSTNIALPSGGRITREVSELLGSVLPTGSYLRVRSAMPVQAMGLLGNDRTGVVLPLSMVVISGPAVVAPAPDPGVSNGGGGGTGGGKGK